MHARPALLTLAIAACGDPPARVALVPIGDGSCGRPAGATGLEITAYTPGGEVVRAVSLDGAVELADLPADTEQLGVEVIVGGGAVGAAGKTAPLAFEALADGATIPIFMAPVDGFCPTGPLGVSRRSPLVARAGDGLLVVGGLGDGGEPLATAERYDLATGAFTPVAVPDVLGENGFIGAALTALPDGRVVVSGGAVPTITVYDPTLHAFGESVLVEGRAFHAALVAGDTGVLLAGGCSDIEAGACAGVIRKSSKRYDADEPGPFEVGPTLQVGRIGATPIDLGVQEDGTRAYLLAGGDAPPGAADASAADLLALDRDATIVVGVHAQAAALDGGAVLSAIDGATAVAAILAPGAAGSVGVAPVPAAVTDLAALRLVALEDGRVLGIGGDPDGAVLRYDPMIDRWERFVLADGPRAAIAPSLHRLDDGSVLVLGDGARALRYRPSLVGPATGALTVVPGGDARQHVLTPVDPTTITRVPDWTLRSGGGLARALVGGPRFGSGSIRAVVRVVAGGVALIARQLGPGDVVIAELSPGEPARLVRVADGTRVTLCTGEATEPFPATAAVTLELAITDRARVTRDGVAVLGCELAAGGRGAWGLGALGAGAAVAVDAVSIARAPD